MAASIGLNMIDLLVHVCVLVVEARVTSHLFGIIRHRSSCPPPEDRAGDLPDRICQLLRYLWLLILIKAKAGDFPDREPRGLTKRA